MNIGELLKIWAKASDAKRGEIRHSWPELGEALDNLVLANQFPMVQVRIMTKDSP